MRESVQTGRLRTNEDRVAHLKSKAFDRLRCHLRLLLDEKGMTANQIARKFVREFQDEVREVRRAI